MRTVLKPSRNVGQASSLSNTKRRQAGSLSYIIMAGFLICSGLVGCGRQVAEKTVRQPKDKPLAAFQTNLLQTAFDVATAMPVEPHIKDRSRTQYQAAAACFELDQPQRALRYIQQIGNWQRGEGCADYAFYCAQHGFTNDIPHYLDLAEQISSTADQDWRRDRIKVRIAETHLLLGQTNQSAHFAARLEPCESGKVGRVEAELCGADDFTAQTNKLGGLIATGDFELVKNSLYACAQLFDRFYDDEPRRTLTEEMIKNSWGKIPYTIRLDLLIELANFSLKHADQPKALKLVEDAKTLMDSVTWRAEDRVPPAARLAALRFRAGDEETARAVVVELLTFYKEHQSEILDIDRADTLITVAEALQAMGDSVGALAVYKQAVEASLENPNSRPRAEDISAICLSMVKHTVEPDAALWARIREIKGALGEPW